MTRVTKHSVTSGDTFVIPANGSRVRLEVRGSSFPTMYAEMFLDSIASGQLAASFSTYVSGHIEFDRATVGDLVERRFEVRVPSVVGPIGEIGVIESVVSGG